MAYLRWRRIKELAALDRPGLAARLGARRNAGAPADHWDEVYRRGEYDGLLGFERRNQHRLLAGLIAERFEAARVLEIGCGDGALWESLRRLPTGRYLGVDVSEEAVARLRARRGADVRAGKVEFTVGDGARFASRERFDAIVFSDCIEYLGDVGALIDHHAGLLAPGGVLACVQWLALGPAAVWDEARPRLQVLDEAVVMAPWGGAWHIWTARPKG